MTIGALIQALQAMRAMHGDLRVIGVCFDREVTGVLALDADGKDAAATKQPACEVMLT